jgi:hypothetical protein
MKQPDIFVSTDIEADGPVPGLHSMLSFGSAAFLPDKTLIGTFSANLETLPEATTHPETMAWWQTQSIAWEACHTNLQPPEQAIGDYCRWLEQLPGRIIFVAYPVAYDFRFIDYYLHRFAGKNPFRFTSIDIRSFTMGMRNVEYRRAGKRYLPKRWFGELKHTHIALDDALEHGTVFCNMLIEQKNQAQE